MLPTPYNYVLIAVCVIAIIYIVRTLYTTFNKPDNMAPVVGLTVLALGLAYLAFLQW
ncbi:hypothetical protein LEM8419_03538 [Neolewinella maritima]|uniref:Uncharacterized protein n=1 Tax=Neolewinella maritima TaxID=1383882 RepID=A0ABN8F9D4_9BACT|nr:hypothetical protein [Neolewinella maritima]CAH1002666.1 hypothetical protein LEM8419_03538 [Neolewinella maritima]